MNYKNVSQFVGWKRRVVIITCISMLLTCCKHDEELKKAPLQPVFAGKISSDMTYINFAPEIELDTLPIANRPDFNENNLRLDLNQDHAEDISIKVSRGNHDVAAIVFFSLSTQANKIGFSCSDVSFIFVSGGNAYNCVGNVNAIEYGTLINNNTCKWSVTDSVDNENHILYNQNYTYKYYHDLDTLNFQPLRNQYIGFRFIENTDTLYGWMRLSVMGKAHIVIHDLAYQKRK